MPRCYGAAMNDSIALVASYYDAFNRGDRQGMLDLLSDDVAHDINQGGREIGKDKFRAFLAHMDECYREHLRDIVLMAGASGRRVAAEFVVEGQYLKTDGDFVAARGQRYTLPAGAFLVVDKGKIARVTTYYNVGDWLKQVR